MDDDGWWLVAKGGGRMMGAIIFPITVTFKNIVDGLTAQKVIDSLLLTQKINTNRTIKVDINGKGERHSSFCFFF
ncbi:unnamed protein product, partial [Prunus brigantina]